MLVVYVRALCLQGEAARKEGWEKLTRLLTGPGPRASTCLGVRRSFHLALCWVRDVGSKGVSDCGSLVVLSRLLRLERGGRWQDGNSKWQWMVREKSPGLVPDSVLGKLVRRRSNALQSLLPIR